ncbi:autotransporter outer membrane beta-barrel domain-containing protein [Bartonella sp. F02]|uniref:autotransporter outer membrane beta-barrel domain-containing protein n=1 Tax=Bartonella sp. F02 TaxID=2967262 RepID=UPI0022A95BBC|nr:autotransporter outer membrane beta-barrel domain-containing protein [Bartonella sp. F02]MCZ2328571.1 autotransporter outer membrane beta-barrel domain-containing protein [Bartonella sp. F02]
MRYKYKLSCSIITISALLIQATNADQNADRQLQIVTVNDNGTVGSNTALITRIDSHNGGITAIKRNITIRDGGVEIVENGGTSMHAHIERGGMQIVTRGGRAISTNIRGGVQFVFEEETADLTNTSKLSTAYNAVVNGSDGITGQQNVYDGAHVWHTIVQKGGEQNLYKVRRTKGGEATGTRVGKGGKQHVLAGGIATNVTLENGSKQIIYPDGMVINLTIESNANSWVYGGTKLGETVNVKSGGNLFLYAGDAASSIVREKILFNNRSVEELFSVGVQNNENLSKIYIGNLTGNGGTVSFFTIPYDPRHLTVYIKDLSGQVNFRFNISNVGNRSDHLLIDQSSGEHTISVMDSGVEFSKNLSQRPNLIADILLITDKSNSEGATFTLVDQLSRKINTVDGGVYTYGLKKVKKVQQTTKITSPKMEKVPANRNTTQWYLSLISDKSHNSDLSSRIRITESQPPILVRTESVGTNSRSSQDRGTSSSRPRRRTPRHLTENSQNSPFLTISPSDSQTSETQSRSRRPRDVNNDGALFPFLATSSEKPPVDIRETQTAETNQEQSNPSQRRKRSPRHATMNLEPSIPISSTSVSLEGNTPEPQRNQPSEANQEQLVAVASVDTSFEKQDSNPSRGRRRSRRGISHTPSNSSLPADIPTDDDSSEVYQDQSQTDVSSTKLHSEYQANEGNQSDREEDSYAIIPHPESEVNHVTSQQRSRRHLESNDDGSRSSDSAFAEMQSDEPKKDVEGGSAKLSLRAYRRNYTKSRDSQRRSQQRSEPSDHASVSSDAQSPQDHVWEDKDQNQFFHYGDQSLENLNFLTTPSTDAILSMAVAPSLVLHNELQHVRSGRGIVNRNKRNASLWVYTLKSTEKVATGRTHFKLEQTGIMLGVDRISELTNGGEFYIGGFGGYDQAHIVHERGGVSNMGIYSLGAYVSYFDNNGWYLDSVLKYNYYQNNLKAVSTNGIDIQGNYEQRAVGTSFEAGYRFTTEQGTWVQPYAQVALLKAEGKNIKLSNDMVGDISPATSLRNEVGLSIGHEFSLSMNNLLTAYATVAWLRENVNDNYAVLNKGYKFVTDLSDNAGKLGVGLRSSVNEKLVFYMEANYVKGQKRKQSFQGVLGLRYSF